MSDAEPREGTETSGPRRAQHRQRITWSRALWRVLQTTFTAALIGFAAWYLWRQWHDPSVAQLHVSLHAGWLCAASAVVLATYLLLVELWRRVLARYGRTIRLLDAARIWFVSNLGKYVPGKVWQVTTMTGMLSRRGVPVGVAASASAVITIANVVGGSVLLLLMGAESLRALGARALPAVLILTIVLLAILLAAPFTTRVLARITARILRRSVSLSTPAGAAWLSLVGCAGAWILYGTAFRAFVLATIGHADAPWHLYVAVFTLSYLVGYLWLPAPGGVGAREWAMTTLFVALKLGTPAEAAVVTVASRLWLTVLELTPGLVFLALRRREKLPTSSH